MSLKKIRVIAVVLTFIISFICHFAYNLFPNFIFSIFFPVNESIWEHMKILYTSILLYGILDYIILKKNGLSVNNFFLGLFIMCFSGIIIYLMFFLPIYYKIGDNMFISISLMLITYIIAYIMDYYVLLLDDKNFKLVWIIFLVIGYIAFGVLTYKPIIGDLFFDPVSEKYGI